MHNLILGAALGLSFGLTPGPVWALVLSGTLRGGLRSGVLVAASPLVIGLPIIVVALTVLTALPKTAIVVAGAAGGLFLLALAVSTFRDARSAQLPDSAGTTPLPDDAGTTVRQRKSPGLWQGMVATLLSPHPWIFWLTTGGPLLVAAWQRGSTDAGAFLFGYYALLVGAKTLLALVVASARHRFGTRGYRVLLVGSGLVLLVTSGVLLVRYGPALLVG